MLKEKIEKIMEKITKLELGLIISNILLIIILLIIYPKYIDVSYKNKYLEKIQTKKKEKLLNMEKELNNNKLALLEKEKEIKEFKSIIDGLNKFLIMFVVDKYNRFQVEISGDFEKVEEYLISPFNKIPREIALKLMNYINLKMDNTFDKNKLINLDKEFFNKYIVLNKYYINKKWKKIVDFMEEMDIERNGNKRRKK